MLSSFGHVRATMLHPGMRTSSTFNTQHVATRCNRVAKQAQHVAPNNVAICCVQMLRSFGGSFMLAFFKHFSEAKASSIINNNTDHTLLLFENFSGIFPEN